VKPSLTDAQNNKNITPRSWFEVFKQAPADELTEANCQARLGCSNQLMNDVSFICSSDKKPIHISYTEKFTEPVIVRLQQKLKTLQQNVFAQERRSVCCRR